MWFARVLVVLGVVLVHVSSTCHGLDDMNICEGERERECVCGMNHLVGICWVVRCVCVLVRVFVCEAE